MKRSNEIKDSNGAVEDFDNPGWGDAMIRRARTACDIPELAAAIRALHRCEAERASDKSDGDER